jgi:hypothetical protein
MRIYYPEEKRTDSEFMRYVAAAETALRDSKREIGAYLEIQDIDLLFSSLPIPGLATAWAAVPKMGSEQLDWPCPIIVFPPALADSIDMYKQAIAHEMFHCASFFLKGATSYKVARWWAEGMATHFSNVVYPEVNLEYWFLPYFDAKSPSKWLMDMSYENFVFFQYLENRFGNEYIVRLLNALPLGGTQSSQASALANFGDMEIIFHEFGEAYMNHQIFDTGGGLTQHSLLPFRKYFRDRV